MHQNFLHAGLLSKTPISFVPMWRMREGYDAVVSALGRKQTLR
jgi:hypothetical protein